MQIIIKDWREGESYVGKQKLYRDTAGCYDSRTAWWSRHDAEGICKAIDISEEYISKLIDGEVHLTPEMAEKLELVLGVPASFWNKLEAIYQEKQWCKIIVGKL